MIWSAGTTVAYAGGCGGLEILAEFYSEYLSYSYIGTDQPPLERQQH